MKVTSRPTQSLITIKALSLTTVLFSFFPCMPAMGQGNIHNPAPPAFSIHDSNRDGLIDYHEYRQLLQRIESHRWAHGRHPGRHAALLPFTTLDTDNNGLISLDELETALEQEHRRFRMRHRMHNPTGTQGSSGPGRL